MSIRIVIVDDQPVVRSGVVTMLSTESDLEVIGQAGDGETAVRLAARSRPDVTRDVSIRSGVRCGMRDGRVPRLVYLLSCRTTPWLVDLNVRGRDRLGGVLREYEHAA